MKNARHPLVADRKREIDDTVLEMLRFASEDRKSAFW